MRQYYSLLLILFLVLVFGVSGEVLAQPKIDTELLNKSLQPLQPADITYEQLFQVIIRILIAIAAVLALVFMVWAGIQFITANGDEEQAKKARSAVLNGMIGVAIIVLSFAIIIFVANFIRDEVNNALTPSQRQSSNSRQVVGTVRLQGSDTGRIEVSAAELVAGSNETLDPALHTVRVELNDDDSSGIAQPIVANVPVGQKVVWKNNGNIPQQVTITDGSGQSFSSGTINGGEEFELPLAQPGLYQFSTSYGKQGTFYVFPPDGEPIHGVDGPQEGFQELYVPSLFSG